MSRTKLVIISGASASGKSHLADVIHEQTGFPLISKDHFKEAMMNVFPPDNRKESEKLGTASWKLLYVALEQLVGFVPGLVVEANFHADYDNSTLQKLASACEATLVYCHTDVETTIHRIEARKEDPSRHPGHFDKEALPTVIEQIEKGSHRLKLNDVHAIDVDSTTDFDPPIDDVVARIMHRE